MWEEIIKSSEYNKAIPKNVWIIDELYEEVGYCCYSREHAFLLGHYLSDVFELIVHCAIISVHKEVSITDDS